MFFKVFNNLVEPNGLDLIFLVFDTYFCITEIDTSLLTITYYIIAIQKPMEKVQKSNISRQFNDTLNTQNGLYTSLVHNLPLNLPFLVFCKKNIGQ